METLKFIFPALTALFGLWGLWINKDKKPLERWMLVGGILATLAGTIAATIVEMRAARLQEVQHRDEVRRLLQPIDGARLHVKLRVNVHGAKNPGLAAILKHFRVEANKKPLQSQLAESLPLTESIKRELFRTATFDLFFFGKTSNLSCKDFPARAPQHWDLVLTTLDGADFQEPAYLVNATWVYRYYLPHHYEALFLERDLRLHFSENNHLIAGVEDIEGSTMIIWGQVLEDYEIADFEFSPRNGVHFKPIGPATRIQTESNVEKEECIRWPKQ